MVSGPKDALFSSTAMAARSRAQPATPPHPAHAETHKVAERVRGGADKPKDTEPSLIEQIRERGLQAYIEDLQEQKKKELREKILREMGLSEDALQKMSPEARAEIEKMVDKEVAKRMQAEGELDRQQKQWSGLDGTVESGMAKGQGRQPAFAQIDGAGVGLGPLLALQEADRFEPSAQRANDEDTGQDLP